MKTFSPTPLMSITMRTLSRAMRPMMIHSALLAFWLCRISMKKRVLFWIRFSWGGERER